MANLRKIKAEEQFKKIQKQDKMFLVEKEKAKQVDQEKMARLKALRLAKLLRSEGWHVNVKREATSK